jgi:hypothetical protein
MLEEETVRSFIKENLYLEHRFVVRYGSCYDQEVALKLVGEKDPISMVTITVPAEHVSS